MDSIVVDPLTGVVKVRIVQNPTDAPTWPEELSQIVVPEDGFKEVTLGRVQFTIQL